MHVRLLEREKGREREKEKTVVIDLSEDKVNKSSIHSESFFLTLKIKNIIFALLYFNRNNNK
jgi:hypothetical protein